MMRFQNERMVEGKKWKAMGNCHGEITFSF